MGGQVQSRRHESTWCELDSGYIVGVMRAEAYLDVLLQILGSLERLSAELTLVRLQRNVDTDV